MIIYFKVCWLATIITWAILISVSQEGEHIGCIHGLSMDNLWARDGAYSAFQSNVWILDTQPSPIHKCILEIAI